MTNPDIAADRWKLRDAYKLFNAQRFPSCTVPEGDLQKLHDRLSVHRDTALNASRMLGGVEVKRTQFKYDDELREQLEKLTHNRDPGVRDEARTYLEYYLAVENLYRVARTVQHI